MLPETLGELLQVSIIVGLVTALLLEKWAWYQNQTPEQKQMWVKVLTLGAGVVITAVNLFVPENALVNAGQWYEVIQPLLNMLLVAMGGTFAMSQATHVVYRWVYRKGSG